MWRHQMSFKISFMPPIGQQEKRKEKALMEGMKLISNSDGDTHFNVTEP